VLALSLRLTSPAELVEVLDGWFRGSSSHEESDLANVTHLADIERDR
jgi:ribose 5-phosphate isomerase B